MERDVTIDFAKIVERQYIHWIDRDHWPLLLRFNELFESDNRRQALSLAREVERRMNDTVTAGFVDAVKSSIHDDNLVSSALSDKSVSDLIRKANERTRISILNHYKLGALLETYQRMYTPNAHGDISDWEVVEPLDVSNQLALDALDANQQGVAEAVNQPVSLSSSAGEKRVASPKNGYDTWSALLVAGLVMSMALLLYFTLFF